MPSGRSIFDRIKNKATCKTFFDELTKTLKYTLANTNDCAMPLFMDIANHCPMYAYVREVELFQNVCGRRSLFFNVEERKEIESIISSKINTHQRAYASIFKGIVLHGATEKTFSGMLSAIDAQAQALGIDAMQFREDILPHLKLAIAYAEAEQYG